MDAGWLWCRYLEESDQSRLENTDAGPDSEVEYWRRRMQRLTSIIDQIKTKGCQTVVSVLTALARLPFAALPGSHGNQKGTLVDLVRRWKGIDSSVTEAANEVCVGLSIVLSRTSLLAWLAWLLGRAVDR